MSEKRETSIGGSAWLFLLIMTINSCDIASHTKRIAAAAERISPKPEVKP